MRKLATAVVLLLCVLAVGGASRKSTYGGGTYGVVGGTYQAGGAPAGWDTVTLFMSCKPDTTHFDGRFAQDRTAAGTAGKLRLGVNTLFRYDVVAQDDTTEGFHTYTTWKNRGDASGGSSILDGRIGQAGRHATLLYVNWEDLIPPNSQIISAKVRGVIITGGDIASFDRADSLVSILMEVPADSVWYTPVAGKTFINGLTYHSFATWGWQRQGYTDMGPDDLTPPRSTFKARGYPMYSRGRWNPALIDRVNPWQIGEWASYSSTKHATTAADDLVDIDITNCVQGAVNGAVNNGIFTTLQNNGSGTLRFWVHGWQGEGVLTKQPWIVVKYLTKRYKSEFPNNARAAFIFSTDDQVQNYNSALTDSFRRYGGAFTIYARHDKMGYADVPNQMKFANYDSLAAWRNKGMEIGSHSRFHWDKWPSGTAFGSDLIRGKWYGLNAYQSCAWGDISTYTPRGGFATCTTGYDSLLYDSEPYWLYDGMGVDATDPYVGKSLATPGNVVRAEVMKAVSHHGYVAARTGQGSYMVLTLSGTEIGQRPFGYIAPFRPSVADTIFQGMLAHNQTQPRNLVWQALDYASSDIVGAKADSTGGARLTTIYNNMRRAMYYAKNRRAGAVNLFTHAHKGNANYSYGINLNEISYILQAVRDDGSWIARSSEYGRWLQSSATPVATPAAFSQPDSFSFTAQDRVWFTEQGIDRRWIRGVK